MDDDPDRAAGAEGRLELGLGPEERRAVAGAEARAAREGQAAVAQERAVDVQINRLRRKIEKDPANPLFLQAVRGIGYRLVASP